MMRTLHVGLFCDLPLDLACDDTSSMNWLLCVRAGVCVYVCVCVRICFFFLRIPNGWKAACVFGDPQLDACSVPILRT